MKEERLFYESIVSLEKEIATMKMADNEIHNLFYSLNKFIDIDLSEFDIQNGLVMNMEYLYDMYTHYDINNVIELIWEYNEGFEYFL